MEPSHTGHGPQILLLDFGGQYAGLIEKRIRSLGVTVERRPGDLPLADARHPGLLGVIGSGGPDSVYAEGAPHAVPAVFCGDLPFLAISHGI